ncbi:MAG: ECF transporter S component [Chloroflexota bacterium]
MKRMKAGARPWSFDWAMVTKMALLLALGLLIPSFGWDQQVTGPLVNALLLVSVSTVGVVGAVMVGVLPSLMALVRGVLPLPMVVMVPYIILGNAALVVVFALLRSRNYWLGLSVAAALKAGLLALAVTNLVVVPANLAILMQWPQLYTALLGGVIAYTALGVYGLARRSRG